MVRKLQLPAVRPATLLCAPLHAADTLATPVDPRAITCVLFLPACLPCLAHTHAQLLRRAKDLIQSNIDILHKTAAVLMEKENIDGDEFQQIVLESQAEQYLKQDAPGVTIPFQAA